jgi:hypothetical protein
VAGSQRYALGLTIRLVEAGDAPIMGTGHMAVEIIDPQPDSAGYVQFNVYRHDPNTLAEGGQPNHTDDAGPA